MKKTKRDRFVRVAEQRTQKVLDDMKSLAKCADPVCYEYSERDVEQICTAIEQELQNLRDAFAGRNRFSLSSKYQSES